MALEAITFTNASMPSPVTLDRRMSVVFTICQQRARREEGHSCCLLFAHKQRWFAHKKVATTHLWVLCLQSRKGQARIAPNDVAVCANQHNGCILASNRHIHYMTVNVRQIHTSSQTVHNYLNGPVRE